MMRFAAVLSAAVLLCSIGSATPAAAQDTNLTLRDLTSSSAPIDVAAPAPAAVIRVPPEHRPAALLPLYASFAALQLVDFHSTRYALDRGAVEANPLMKGFVNSGVGLLAIKAAGTTGLILASEHMQKKNKVAAVVFMVAANSAMAWVVQHNYRAVR